MLDNAVLDDAVPLPPNSPHSDSALALTQIVLPVDRFPFIKNHCLSTEGREIKALEAECQKRINLAEYSASSRITECDMQGGV